MCGTGIGTELFELHSTS